MLQRGYSVRGTVRSKDKGEYLKKLYEKDGLTNFEYVIVEDMEKVKLSKTIFSNIVLMFVGRTERMTRRSRAVML